MKTPATLPPRPPAHPSPPSTHPYEPPRLTGKRPLENVTLASTLGGGNSPPGAGWVGHP